MRRLTWIFGPGFCLLMLGAWFLGGSAVDQAGLARKKSAPVPDTASGRAVTVVDPAEVFQKAFWKRPAAGDSILHAERREWKTEDGVSKWQWFISVRPSPALVRHLIKENAFMLAKLEEGGILPPQEPPEWFPSSTAGYEVMANASQSFRLLWDREKNLLHATDSGGGFQPGAPEPLPRQSVSASKPGRFPHTPPPDPRDEVEPK